VCCSVLPFARMRHEMLKRSILLKSSILLSHHTHMHQPWPPCTHLWVLQGVAIYGSVLQCVAVRCRVCCIMWCGVLQCVAVCRPHHSSSCTLFLSPNLPPSLPPHPRTPLPLLCGTKFAQHLDDFLPRVLLGEIEGSVVVL